MVDQWVSGSQRQHFFLRDGVVTDMRGENVSWNNLEAFL